MISIQSLSFSLDSVCPMITRPPYLAYSTRGSAAPVRRDPSLTELWGGLPSGPCFRRQLPRSSRSRVQGVPKVLWGVGAWRSGNYTAQRQVKHWFVYCKYKWIFIFSFLAWINICKCIAWSVKQKNQYKGNQEKYESFHGYNYIKQRLFWPKFP